MAEKTFLGLRITFSIILTGIVVVPARSYDVSLVTIPNKGTFYHAAGEPFNITCTNSAEDADKFSSLKWLNQEGSVITEGVLATKVNETNSLTLMFVDPKEDNSGVYKCIAIYDKKQTLQKAVSIIFHASQPNFDPKFHNETVKENSFLKIACVAEGELPITYEWFDQVENEDKITENSDSSIYVSGSVNVSELTIPRVRLDHAGMYTCTARNRHGSSSKIFQLTVLSSNGDKVSVRDASVVSITATSVKFEFELTRKAGNIEAQFGPKFNETLNSAQCIPDDCVIGGLDPAQRYYFKFRTSSDDKWSKSYEVVLLPDKPEVIFESMSSGTVKFQWLFKFSDRMKKTIDKHEITYFSLQMEGGNSFKQFGCPITIQIPECSSSKYTITGLSNSFYYEIQLRAHTVSGYGEPYTQKIFLT